MAGGFFDGKTGADERRQYLLDLFKRSAEQDTEDTGAQALSNDEVILPYIV
jgi:hypothetical protein